MGKALGSVPIIGGLFGGSGSVQASPIDKTQFDLTQEAKPAQTTLGQQLTAGTALAAQTNPQVAAVMNAEALAAEGKGPSLAEAQMKAAQDRTLAQQLAMTTGRGGNAATAERNLVQASTAAGRGIAQDTAQARLQERQNFLSQAALQNQQLNATAGQQMSAAFAPKQAMQNYTLQNAQMQNQMNQFNEQQSQAAIGGLLGGVASGLGSGGFLKSFMGGGGGGGGGALTANTPPPAGGYTFKYAEGGPIDGPGTERSDSIPAMLSKGEFVVKAAAVKRPGMLEHLKAINDNGAPSPAEIQEEPNGEPWPNQNSDEDAKEAPGRTVASAKTPFHALLTKQLMNTNNPEVQKHVAKSLAHLIVAKKMSGGMV